MMKILLFSLFLTGLFVLQPFLIQAQQQRQVKKATASTHSANTPAVSPNDLGEASCICGFPCAALSPALDTYSCVERMPMPPQGYIAFSRAVASQVQPPINQPQLTGRVWATFVVTKTGELTDFKISKGLSPAYDAEALRVLQQQQPWTPGYQSGQAVRVQILTYVPYASAQH
ncbi:energy transducer TonB [Hymenobacter sp. BT507]|uniref:Energy transducer TonB n=2 Tax=Hymenobacter citatus TaxID=2763506 RepID=A0ABR7ML34_9BACT|nr:energy transducer TonB [Hymenobacter citatus]